MKPILRLRRTRDAVPVPLPAAEPADTQAAPGENVVEPDLVGYIDRIGAGTVQGWAASRSEPARRLTVRLYLDDDLAAAGVAKDSRNDVRDAGYGDGLYGFDFEVSKTALFCAELLNIAIVGDDGDETVIQRHRLRRPLAAGAPCIYFDASDLVEFFTDNRELSGIQRVQAGYLLGLGNAVIADTQCRICTRFRMSSFYFDIPYEAFAALLKAAGDLAAVPKGAWAGHIRRFKESLTARTEFGRGDTIFTMGAPWSLDNHNETIRCAKFFYGAHYLQVFYDLIPISLPEVVAAPLIPHFARAIAAMSIYADHVYAISRYSRDDLAHTLRRLKRPVPPIDVLLMGGTITDAEGETSRSDAEVLAKLGISRPFVLCVGTLEPRKNHALLFQIWRRLVAKRGAENVPNLVLVGRVGWYMEDFMRQLKVTGHVERTVVHLQGVSNSQLAVLYDACIFTVFPSFSEGWGLPITESLARSKICVCSNVTSMPEAGGDHALYIDPFDPAGALALCEKLIDDSAFRAEQEARIRHGFAVPRWADASHKLRALFTDLLPRLAILPTEVPRKPIELGRPYKFFNVSAASPDATATEVLRDFLEQEDALDLLVGWNWFDVDMDCTWACGPQAQLSLALPSREAAFMAYLDLVVPPAYSEVPCEVSVDGLVRGRFEAPRGRALLAVDIDAPVAGTALISFQFDGDRISTADARLLGIGIATVALFAADDYEGRLHFMEGRGVRKTI